MKRQYQTPAVESFDSDEIVRLIGPAVGYGTLGSGVSSNPFEDMTGGSSRPGKFGF